MDTLINETLSYNSGFAYRLVFTDRAQKRLIGG